MFSTTVDASWNERSRQGFSALFSFGLQAIVLLALLLLPLLRPTGLPFLRELSAPVSLGRLSADAPAQRPHSAASTTAQFRPSDIAFRTPSWIPHGVRNTTDDAPPQIGNGTAIGDGVASGNVDGIPNIFSNSSGPVMPAPQPAPTPHTLRISQMSQGDLIHKVVPTYPAPARNARIQGQVVLQALISKQGTIENLRLLSGHPLLVAAAIEAVRQWRYRPYMLNHEPVEVETQITVNFSLGEN